MNITILTAGTRGDVQPFVALALGLERAGYRVKVATGTNFEGFVRQHGLGYEPLHIDFLELMKRSEGRGAVNSPRGSMVALRVVMPRIRQVLEDGWRAAQGADAIIYHPKALSGYHIAERLGVPAFIGAVLPIITPTRHFANPILPVSNLGGLPNRWSYTGLLSMTTAPFNRIINDWRREVLGLASRRMFADESRLKGAAIPVLNGFSRHIVPPPPDWPASTHVTGYWFLDERDGWDIPPDLKDFLASGQPPVYVGFGSMAGPDPNALGQTILGALERSGQRGIVAAGWGGISAAAPSEGVFITESVPHSWLFPRVSAVIHHGGSGTTGEGLRAGKPTVVCPFFGDQPFWGRRIHKLGAGPRPIPHKALTSQNLAEAIRMATEDQEIGRKADQLGQAVRGKTEYPKQFEPLGRYSAARNSRSHMH